jgi:hypothetical protein
MAIATAPNAVHAASPPAKQATQASLHSPPNPEDAGTATTTEVVELRPTVLVMPSGVAYLVLRAGPEQRGGALTWSILYLAGHDPAELAQPDARPRVAAVERDLVAAFGPIADLTRVERLSVTAIAGTRGANAAVERRWFTREAGGWRAEAAATERTVTQLPALEPAAREPDHEASARELAAAFISDADRADWDAAWAKTSAVVRASVSRVEFERYLQSTPRARSARGGALYLSFPVLPQRFLPGANIVAWIARETVADPAVATLELRLDDDVEWRVSGIVVLAAAQSSSPPREEERAPMVEPESAL